MKLGAAGTAAAALLGWAGRADVAEAAEPLTLLRAGRPKRPPNILFILADDLGWGDTGCYGSPVNKTPNIDQLAREGLRFTNAYSGSATCSPTRFSLYTGRYPGRLPGGLQEPILDPDPLIGLPPGFPTLAALLASAGYETGMVGKWHCGFLPDYGPLKSGWQEFYGCYGSSIDYFSYLAARTGSAVRDLYEGDVPVPPDQLGYVTDLFTKRAVAFIRKERNAPFLLNLNFTAPHWPWEGPGDQAVSEELGQRMLSGTESSLFVAFHTDGGSVQVYANMVASLDAAVGEVLRALRRSGLERDTLVILTSDNGGERFSYQWPFSGGKATLLEGGIRVPLIARWPGYLPRGQVSDQPNVTMDWTATLLEVGGTSPQASTPLDGVSLLSFLVEGAPFPAHDLFWRTHGDQALRRGAWKYRAGPSDNIPVSAPPTPPPWLTNVVTDPGEHVNLAEKQAQRTAEFKAAADAISSSLLPYREDDPFAVEREAS